MDPGVVLFVVLQPRVQRTLSEPEMWFIVFTSSSPYVECTNYKDSGETARIRRLAWAFAVRLCDHTLPYSYGYGLAQILWPVAWELIYM